MTTNWATWDLPRSYDYDSQGTTWDFTYAPGATGSVVDPLSNSTISFTLSGEVASMSADTSTMLWNDVYTSNPATAYLSQYVGTSPSVGAFITQTGFTESQFKAHSLSFTSSVSDMIMGIWSLGSAGTEAELTFSQPFEILSSNGRFTSSGDSVVGYKLAAFEGVGVLQFLGTYSQLNWVVTAPEYFSAFNIGFTSAPLGGYPTPTPYQFPARDLPTPFGDSGNGSGNGNGNAIPNITTSSGNLFNSVNSTVTTVFDGGTLSNEESAATSNAFSLTDKGGTIDAAGHDLTFSGAISNHVAETPGALAIESSATGGRVILEGANSYTGATSISSGAKLTLSGAGSIATSSGVAVDGEFHISDTTNGAAVTKISGAGSIALGTRTLTLTDATGTFAGTIAGTGGVTVAGGSETLTGTNTYSGTTTVASGATLNIGAGSNSQR